MQNVASYLWNQRTDYILYSLQDSILALPNDNSTSSTKKQRKLEPNTWEKVLLASALFILYSFSELIFPRNWEGILTAVPCSLRTHKVLTQTVSSSYIFTVMLTPSNCHLQEQEEILLWFTATLFACLLQVLPYKQVRCSGSHLRSPERLPQYYHFAKCAKQKCLRRYSCNGIDLQWDRMVTFIWEYDYCQHHLLIQVSFGFDCHCLFLCIPTFCIACVVPLPQAVCCSCCCTHCH